MDMGLLKKFKKLGDDQINQLVLKLAENETFVKVVTTLFTTKEALDKQTSAVLNAVNIASEKQARELSDRVGQLDRQVRKLKKEVEELQAAVKELKAARQEPAATEEHGSESGTEDGKPKRRGRKPKQQEDGDGAAPSDSADQGSGE